MKKIVSIFVLALIILLSACSKEEVLVGVFQDVSDASAMAAWVELKEDGTFVFNRGGVLSHRLNGTFILDAKTLILKAQEGDYHFKVEGSTLVFESGALAEGFVEVGTKFEACREE